MIGETIVGEFDSDRDVTAWMAGTSPAMTAVVAAAWRPSLAVDYALAFVVRPWHVSFAPLTGP